jgi:hypothetical protein
MADTGMQMGREMALEAGAATTGQAAGMLTGPAAFVAVPAFGGLAALSANIANQKMRKGQNDIHYGEAVSAFLSGAIPGATMAKSGGRIMGKIIAPVAKEVTANLAAAEAQSIIDNGRVLTPKEASLIAAVSVAGSAIASKMDDSSILAAIQADRSVSAPKQKFITTAVNDGYQIWPTASLFSGTRANAQKLANPKKMQLGMATHNLEKASQDIRADLDLFKDGVPLPITRDMIEARQQGYNAVYKDIADTAGMTDELKEMLDMRSAAKYNFERAEAALANARPLPEIRKYEEAGASLRQNAIDLEDKILKAAGAINAELPARFKATREMYAKSYAVLDAVDPVLGFEPSKLAKWQNKKAGQPLTGRIGQVAKLAQQFGDIMMGPKGIYELQNSIVNGAGAWPPHILGPVVRPMLTSGPVQRYAASQPARLGIGGVNAYTAPGMEAVLQGTRAMNRKVPLDSYLKP